MYAHLVDELYSRPQVTRRAADRVTKRDRIEPKLSSECAPSTARLLATSEICVYSPAVDGLGLPTYSDPPVSGKEANGDAAD